VKAGKESGAGLVSNGARAAVKQCLTNRRVERAGQPESSLRSAPPMPAIDPEKSLREWETFFRSCPPRRSEVGRQKAERARG
jgi:hypothetical protein